MHVMFFGTAAFAVPSFEALIASGHRVVRCVTQPDRAQGRGLKVEPSPVKQVALKHAVVVAQPERLTADVMEGVTPDVGVVVAYGRLVPGDVLRAPAHGMLGVHPSLLPKYRGAAPVAWAVLDGETSTGVTIFRLTERLDAGEIIAQSTTSIHPGETAEALTDRLACLGAQELIRALEALASGRVEGRPQTESDASVAPKLTKAQGRIDWAQPAAAIERLVRATVPWPGASTDWQGARLNIWTVALSSAGDDGSMPSPGTVVRASPEGLEVATGQGRLVITEVQRAGKRRMNVREFLAGHSVRVGDQLGSPHA